MISCITLIRILIFLRHTNEYYYCYTLTKINYICVPHQISVDVLEEIIMGTRVYELLYHTNSNIAITKTH